MSIFIFAGFVINKKYQRFKLVLKFDNRKFCLKKLEEYSFPIFNFISKFAVTQIEGLVAHWSFDNDSLQVIRDNSGNGINGASNEIEFVSGIKGKAILFDSPQNAVFFPGKNQSVPEKIGNLTIGSISVWFNFQNLEGNILPVLYFGESSENEAHNSLIIEIGHGPNEGDPQNRRLYFTIVNQGFCYDSKVNLAPNIWYHFVLVVSSTGNTGYLNGVELTNRNYNLGSNSTYSDFFADVPAKEVLSLGYGRFGQNDRFSLLKG